MAPENGDSYIIVFGSPLAMHSIHKMVNGKSMAYENTLYVNFVRALKFMLDEDPSITDIIVACRNDKYKEKLVSKIKRNFPDKNIRERI